MARIYLQAHTINFPVLLAAVMAGFLAVGVLNLNNIRDLDTDKQANKITIPVRLGFSGAKFYHALLLGTAVVLAAYLNIHCLHNAVKALLLTCIPMFLIVMQVMAVYNLQNNLEADPLLKRLAISALLLDVAVGAAHILTC